METMNKRFLSNGFERRTQVERRAVWNRIPAKVDILLLTHVPPSGFDSILDTDVTGEEADGCCQILSRHIYANPERPSLPLLHAFGHWHPGFGVSSYKGRIIMSDGCQDYVMSNDIGATPLVVDLQY
jgi:hypothetical protein